MRNVQRSAKMTLDALMSFMIWTSVFALGIVIGSTLIRLLLASSLKFYRLIHS